MGNQTVDAREVNTQHPSNADAEIDLVEVFYLMWQNLWKILLCLFAGAQRRNPAQAGGEFGAASAPDGDPATGRGAEPGGHRQQVQYVLSTLLPFGLLQQRVWLRTEEA